MKMDKTKRRLYSGLTSLAFVMLGIYLIFTSENYGISPMLVLSVGVITVLFFELVAVISLKDFFSKSK
jgi:hypothetical protein